MTTYKIKYKNYISNLYLPEVQSGKVIILLTGLPMSLDIKNIMTPMLEAGCIVFYPSYSGTYDSGGNFSGTQSIMDVEEFINMATQTEVTELYFNKKIVLGSNNKIFLAGMSYGATIALLGVSNKIDKLLLLSPVFLYNHNDIKKIVDFDFSSQMKSLLSLLRDAYPFSYRITDMNILEDFLYGRLVFLRKDKILEKLTSLRQQTLITHGSNDLSVPIDISEALQKNVSNQNIIWEFTNSNHSTSSYDKQILSLIKKFLEKK